MLTRKRGVIGAMDSSPGSPQIESVYRNVVRLHSVHLRPSTKENLLIPAYMPAELAQIDFGKKGAEILRRLRLLSHCKKTVPLTRATSQTEIDFVA